MVNQRSGLGYENSESSNPNPDLAQIMQALVTALNANRRNQNRDDEPMTRTREMNEFCKRRPPTFNGDTNPTMVETWLKEVKVILDTLKITQNGDPTMTFAKFEALFLDKYFPTPLCLAKEQEFLNLKQGTMTVTQYAAKFEELSHYTQTVVAMEDKKARRFEWGLTTARRAVVAQAFPTYFGVVSCALRLESEENDFKTRWRKAIGNTDGPIRTQHSNNNRGPYPTLPNPSPRRKTTNIGRLLHQDEANRRGAVET
ncbi:uncharacterized protein LOC131299657 [Rhododendron vialii]|uniref:uncharacterized protein LOC131299657 n=1 Tax=Rhododendron vialii TaxID=182163 RepID=UPI00265DC62B|nr:uncharacterized protein LOC131299657 [Rhododendron vialii]